MQSRIRSSITVLKIFVYTMGVVLMIGATFITYTVYDLYFLHHNTSMVGFDHVVASEITGIAVQEDSLFLLTKPFADLQQVLVLDRKSNSVIQRIQLKIQKNNDGADL